MFFSRVIKDGATLIKVGTCFLLTYLTAWLRDRIINSNSVGTPFESGLDTAYRNWTLL
jgi:hypothetical protein